MGAEDIRIREGVGSEPLAKANTVPRAGPARCLFQARLEVRQMNGNFGWKPGFASRAVSKTFGRQRCKLEYDF